MKTGQQLLEETRARIREVNAAESVASQKRGDDVVYLDVREPNEWNLGRVPGAVFIPRGNLESKVEGKVPRDRRVVVYCARGNRSAFAADTMQQMGYGDVVSMAGGWAAWVAAGGDVEG
jgi:rhodanese-related sulfurtransferase